MDAVRVELADTNRVHEADLAPGQNIPVVLRVIFRKDENAFDVQEIYHMVAIAKCRNFDRLIRQQFWQALRLAGLGGLFDQLYTRPLKDIEEDLLKLQTRFSVLELFSNVECVKVVITPKAEVDFC